MDIRAKVREWLLDDLGSAPFQMETKNDPLCEAEIRAKSEGILAGSLFLGIIFDETQRLLALDRPEPAEWRWEKKDGDALAPGDLVATVRGHAQVLLKTERTALNILSYTSEIATHTARVMRELGDPPESFAGVLDTRKGRPGLMYFEKYAVRIGGGKNHRLGMFDGDLIKDNDIAVAGSIRAAIDAQWGKRYMVDIQIEVQSFEQLDEVMDDGRVHMVLLDNMDAATLRDAVARARGRGTASRTGKRYVLEASGIKGAELGEIARTGVDYLSTSSLVRSAPPLDFNMKIVRVPD
ncbi:MAG TPA: carboxylating nicotinate-nucleotide diphosphorylase [Nitrospinae bacterium]|nr:carboxylating nicotinate-nucleotide diphosphorylase [Nitrospinota bacterium]